MNLQKRLEIYRADYFFHIDFKEKIYARMVLFSVFITACLTANFSMQETLVEMGCTQLTIIMMIWLLGALILVFVIYNFICITSLRADEWVNSNSEMETYRETLRQHFIANSQNPTEDEINNYVNDQFSIYLIGQYAGCSSIFNENNIFRQKSLSKLAMSTYILLILTFIVSLFFVYQKFEGENNVTKHPTSTSTTSNKSN